MKFRRFSDSLRLLADEAWAKGRKELAEELHEKAREVEREKVENERRKT